MSEVSRLNRPSAWDLGNEVLYSFCAEYPAHTEPDVIVAKLWLIGRACAAPIERGRPMPGGLQNEGFYTGRVVPMVLASPVDGWIDELRGARLDWDDLPRILRAHKRFTDLFKSISGRSQRALASKYLHFHRPDLFFIYDPRSEKAVRALAPRPRRLQVPKNEVDSSYALFARRCLETMETLAPESPVPLGPRPMDRYLLGY